MNINQKREVVLENVWSEYDFKDRVVSGINGWERSSVNEYRRVFFLEMENAPSQRAVFTVEFKPGSVLVEDLGWI